MLTPMELHEDRTGSGSDRVKAVDKLRYGLDKREEING
jgi:hypothetical protein